MRPRQRLPRPALPLLQLRQATPADLAAIMALEYAGFAAGIVEDEAVFSHRLAAFPEGFLLAEIGGKPCGYFCAEIWRDWSPTESERFDLGHDVTHWLQRDGTVIYIASMTLAPEFRGGGMGYSLLRRSLDSMADRFPALNEAVLIVNEHWHAARRIYAQAGFSECGRLPGFFVPVCDTVGDAILMTGPLQLRQSIVSPHPLASIEP